jgi:small subunit ribosomal protein S20
MPTSLSAKKRHRQNEKLRIKNRATKSVLKTNIRKLREAVVAGDVAKAEESLRTTSRLLDKAGASRVLHKNKTSRLKSRLSAYVKKAKSK